jgi:uncharacterized SAM-binding protein YcdF (DUF218 family)
MFMLSKLLAGLLQPLSWVLALLLAALALRRCRPRLSSGLLAGAVLGLLVLGWEPLPDALLRRLESQHPPPEAPQWPRYAGVIVLGGALEPPYVWEGHTQPALNDAAERMTAALALLRQAPHLALLFTGGEGDPFPSGLSEAERARRFYAAMGLPPQRLLLESASRTTAENARLSAALPGVDPSRPWLLLTSAWHMPRALAAFRHAGWNVTPWPTDYRSGRATPWWRYSWARALPKWQTALHEYVGLWLYRLSGRA